MLDIDKIRMLVEMMVKNDLVEVSLRDGEEEINLRRPNPAGEGRVDFGAMPRMTVSPPGGDASAPAPAPSPKVEDVELVPIPSPMVGTFYAAPDPDSPPFVQLGQQISTGAVVCVLEAMKVFNEIKSEITGTIERILVKNQEPVEFGQPLFLVRPT